MGRILLVGIPTVALVAAGVGLFAPIAPPKLLRFRQLTNTHALKGRPFPATNVVYFTQYADANSGPELMQMSTEGGIPVALPTSLVDFVISDISPSGSELLVRKAAEDDDKMPLWILPVPSGTPRRVGNLLARDASYFPDGAKIFYATGKELWEAQADGNGVHKLFTAGSTIYAPRISPDAKKVRFSTILPDDTLELWEAASDGGNVHRLLFGSKKKCCGMWTPDGKYYVYGASDGDRSIWAVREPSGMLSFRHSDPVQLFVGPIQVTRPMVGRQGSRLFFAGERQQAELQLYDTKASAFVPFLGGLPAEQVEVSLDGKWVSYVTYPEGSLWRSRLDGSENLKLSPPDIRVGTGGTWSPDGKRVAFSTYETPRRLYVVSADGGELEALLVNGDLALVHDWTPDGKSLVLGSWTDVPNPKIHIFNLDTNQLTDLPGSEGLIYSLVSPDGRYITGESEEDGRRELYDMKSKSWRHMQFPHNFNFWSWSRDSQYLYYDSIWKEGTAVFRYRVSDGKSERVIDLKGLRRVNGSFGKWFGLGPGDAPMLLRDTGSSQIYAIDWEAP